MLIRPRESARLARLQLLVPLALVLSAGLLALRLDARCIFPFLAAGLLRRNLRQLDPAGLSIVVGGDGRCCLGEGGRLPTVPCRVAANRSLPSLLWIEKGRARLVPRRWLLFSDALADRDYRELRRRLRISAAAEEAGPF